MAKRKATGPLEIKHSTLNRVNMYAHFEWAVLTFKVLQCGSAIALQNTKKLDDKAAPGIGFSFHTCSIWNSDASSDYAVKN